MLPLQKCHFRNLFYILPKIQRKQKKSKVILFDLHILYKIYIIIQENRIKLNKVLSKDTRTISNFFDDNQCVKLPSFNYNRENERLRIENESLKNLVEFYKTKISFYEDLLKFQRKECQKLHKIINNLQHGKVESLIKNAKF